MYLSSPAKRAEPSLTMSLMNWIGSMALSEVRSTVFKSSETQVAPFWRAMVSTSIDRPFSKPKAGLSTPFSLRAAANSLTSAQVLGTSLPACLSMSWLTNMRRTDLENGNA